ncbi:zinc ribbon domain-containing protein [Vibrio sp. FNV 38]|nr:zinc ribbon domain-containing protein [Vibrio sp. FNV 38]
MNENNCLKCQRELEWDAGYTCSECATKYKKIGYCPDCSMELEKLQACGSASYFCNCCNELKSKSRVQFEFKPQ